MLTRELFRGAEPAEVSIQAKIVELERELKYRKYVYKRLVDSGKLERRTAEQRTLILRAILEDYYTQNRRSAS